MERLRFSRAMRDQVLRLIQFHMRIPNLSRETKDSALKRLVNQVGDETPLLVLLTLADKEASRGILSVPRDDVVEGHCFRILEFYGEKDIVHPNLVLKMTRAELVFGGKGHKRLTGPITWTRPGTGEQLQVYERTNRDKRQLFALSSRKDGLGRVYDSRYGRNCIDEVKFPVGYWKQGETRSFDVSCNNGTLKRRIELTIEEIDYSCNGIPHSLRYRWVTDGGKGHDTDMVYIYSPGFGLVSVTSASRSGPGRDGDE